MIHLEVRNWIPYPHPHEIRWGIWNVSVTCLLKLQFSDMVEMSPQAGWHNEKSASASTKSLLIYFSSPRSKTILGSVQFNQIAVSVQQPTVVCVILFPRISITDRLRRWNKNLILGRKCHVSCSEILWNCTRHSIDKQSKPAYFKNKELNNHSKKSVAKIIGIPRLLRVDNCWWNKLSKLCDG